MSQAECIVAFENCCDELVKSQFIMSANKMRNVLKCLAYYEDLRDIVNKSSHNFDYKAEYNRSVVALGNKKAFNLPTTSLKVVALTTAILLDFDENKLDSTKFIRDYFPTISANASFKLFCRDVIEPFRSAVKFNYLPAQPVTTIGSDSKADDAIILINEAIIELSEPTLVEIIGVIKSLSIDSEVKKEAMLVVEGYMAALQGRDTRAILISFIGMKNTVNEYKEIQKLLLKLKDVLETYIIV